MIKINLLPIKQARKQQSALKEVLLLLLIVLVVAILIVVHWSSYNTEIANLKQRVARTKEEIEKMEKIIGEVNQFTATRKALEEKLKIIEVLKKGRTGPVRMMDEISVRVPSKIWLESLKESALNIELEGKAASDEDVALFLGELEKSKYFKKVELKYTRGEAEKKGGATVKKFEITAVVDYTI